MTRIDRKPLAATLRTVGRYLMEGLQHMTWMAYAPDPRLFCAGGQVPAEQATAPPGRADTPPEHPDMAGRPVMRAYRVDEYVIWLEGEGDVR